MVSKKTGITLGITSIFVYLISLWIWNAGIYIPRIVELATFLSLILGIIGIVASIKSKTFLGITLNTIGILIPLLAGIAFLGQA